LYVEEEEEEENRDRDRNGAGGHQASRPATTTVVELGSGCGLTAVGLAAHGHTVVATDMCPDALSNLRHNLGHNAETIKRAGGQVFVEKVIAVEGKNNSSSSSSSSEYAAPQPRSSLPPPGSLTTGSSPGRRPDTTTASTTTAGGSEVLAAAQQHQLPPPPFWLPRHTKWLVGADLVYHGGAQSPDLCALLASALVANPNLRVVLIVVDRFSGGGFAAVASLAGVGLSETPAITKKGGSGADPAITQFEGLLEKAGLAFKKGKLPDEVLARVHKGLPVLDRLSWELTGTADGLLVYEISFGAAAKS
jgi:hypothetical protein